MLCLSLLGMLAARMVGIRLPARCQPAWALVRHARLSLQASLADRRPVRQASMLHVRGSRVDRRRVASALQLLQARARALTPAELQVHVQVYSVCAQVPLIRHLRATCSRFSPAHGAADVEPELPADGVAGRRARGRAARRRLARAAGGRTRGARRPARAARPGPARRLRARGCAPEAHEAPCQSQRPCALLTAGQQVGAQAQTRRTPCGAALCLQGSPSLTSGGTTPAKA